MTAAAPAGDPPRPCRRLRPEAAGLNYVGIAVPVGGSRATQMDGLAEIAEECGSGELRLTVWQNVIMPDVPDDKPLGGRAQRRGIGLHTRATSVTAGLVACTGNTGCKFAATNTKGHAVEIGSYLDRHVVLDRPINIHLTGCPNSCAQHYVGDIGLLGVPVPRGGGTVEGYNLYLGGGTDQGRGLAREIARNIPAGDVPKVLARLLDNYQGRAHAGRELPRFRASPGSRRAARPSGPRSRHRRAHRAATGKNLADPRRRAVHARAAGLAVGLPDGAVDRRRTPAAAPRRQVALAVLYASQTGTAEGLARKFAKFAKARGIDAKPRDIGALDSTNSPASARRW